MTLNFLYDADREKKWRNRKITLFIPYSTYLIQKKKKNHFNQSRLCPLSRKLIIPFFLYIIFPFFLIFALKIWYIPEKYKSINLIIHVYLKASIKKRWKEKAGWLTNNFLRASRAANKANEHFKNDEPTFRSLHHPKWNKNRWCPRSTSSHASAPL